MCVCVRDGLCLRVFNRICHVYPGCSIKYESIILYLHILTMGGRGGGAVLYDGLVSRHYLCFAQSNDTIVSNHVVFPMPQMQLDN